MVYFLGRDVKVLLGTENISHAVDNNSGIATVIAEGSESAANNDIIKRTALDVGNSTGLLDDVTAVDITLGAVDEDVAYMGQRTALKAEIKKETTVTVTKKKTDSFYSHVFSQGLRYGVADSTTLATSVEKGLAQPDADFGYRLLVALKDGGEVVSIAGCTFSEYAVTLNADGITEETLTFISHIQPHIADQEETGAIGSVTEFVL